MAMQAQLKTLSRGLDVLELIEASPTPVSLTEIAHALDEAAPIIYRVLQTLEARGYVYRRPADKRYVHTGRSTGSGAITRAIDLLQAVSEVSHQGGDLPGLSRRSGLEEPLVEELLAPLAQKRLVECRPEDGRWRLSYSLLEIARPLLNGDGLESMMRPVMEAVHRKTGETVSLFRTSGSRQVVSAVIPSAQPVRYVMDVGSAYPLYLGAGGKAALAAMPEADVLRLLDESDLEPITDYRPDRDSLLDELRLIRERGYAVSTGERVEGASAVTVAVRDSSGVLRAVMGVMMPSFRAEAERLETLGAYLIQELARLHLPAVDSGSAGRATAYSSRTAER
ncbi:MAG: IclR family transcriptional regulator [Ectothiorhodospiraceae bacterium]|nr:IclR family transcriptional regulator [Ectothiorhodospiraceae bacterium]MCH8504952.1 IclR family transcriptional regulator [Ectothiorhodospiraceae bacterium]